MYRLCVGFHTGPAVPSGVVAAIARACPAVATHTPCKTPGQHPQPAGARGEGGGGKRRLFRLPAHRHPRHPNPSPYAPSQPQRAMPIVRPLHTGNYSGKRWQAVRLRRRELHDAPWMTANRGSLKRGGEAVAVKKQGEQEAGQRNQGDTHPKGQGGEAATSPAPPSSMARSEPKKGGAAEAKKTREGGAGGRADGKKQASPFQRVCFSFSFLIS